MIRLLYSLFFLLLLPLIVLRLWLKGRANPAYRSRWLERFGVFTTTVAPGGIWVHAVSVGETIAALPLIDELLKRYPALPITVTTTTPTGSDRVKAALGERVFHVYAPYDLPICVAAFLRRIKPCVCIVMETELWPNMVALNQRAGIKTLLINARLSQKSAGGYRRFACLTQTMLRQLDAVAAQQKNDARRFLVLGAKPDAVAVTGSIKSDVKTSEAQQQSGLALRQQLGINRYVVIAASTHDGEETQIVSAFVQLKKRISDAVLILVPRHPERFETVAQLAQQTGLTVARRSLHNASSDCNILLGDTMGELMVMYAAADVAFIGGSLIVRGGHNLLEAAAWKLPILQGPHTFNFAVLTQQFKKADAITVVQNETELTDQWLRFSDVAQRQQAGQRAWLELERQRGALPRVMKLIEKSLR